MENTTSNAPIRRSATRKAVFLTLIPMLLAGMAGGFFPLSKFWKTYESGKFTQSKLDSLLLLEKNMNTLLVYLDSIDTKWEKITLLDKEWESKTEKEANVKGNLQMEIEKLQDQIQDYVNVIEKSNFGMIGNRAAYAHQLLLKSQKAIWHLRYDSPLPPEPCPPSDPNPMQCREDMQKISSKVKEAARDLAVELKSIQDANTQIRKLWGQRNKLIQQKIENSATEIKTITNRLRDL